MKQLLITILVVGALAWGGFQLWKKWDEKNRLAKTARQPRTAQVESRDIRFAIAAAGDIGPADQVSVRPEINGRIALLPVDIGDEVKKGDLLFTLDDQDLQIEYSARQTEIEGAKLQLEKARRNYERAAELFKQSLVSKEVFENARTDFDLARNSVEKADKALKLVEDRLSKTKILAPFDCTVLTRPVSIGQAVSGSGGFNSGTEVMTIADLKNMIITAHISQADVTRIEPGQAVDIQVESVPGLKMKGVVERIAPQATMKNNLKGFSARIAIQDIDARVRPGMTANLSIPVDAADGVLAIPLAAVFTDRGERHAYVKNGSAFERQSIQIGISDYSHAEVTSGLKSGDVVSLEMPANAIDAKGGGPGKRTGESGSGGGQRTGSGTGRPGGASQSRPAGH